MLRLSGAYLSDHAAAGERLKWAADHYPAAAPHGDIGRYGFHVGASAFCYHAMRLWLRGFSDTAVEATRRAVEVARTAGNSVACLALAKPASLLLLDRGELNEAEHTILELADHATENGSVPSQAFASCARGCLAAATGNPAGAVEFIQSGLSAMQESRYFSFYPFFLAELAKAKAGLGQYREGLNTIDAAIQLVIDTKYLWFLPEALRIKADMLASEAAADGDAVEALFARSMTQAHQRGTLHWELRTATSLVTFRRARGRSEDARQALESVYRRFSEGFETPHLRHAHALLH
jgi:non-specific serine/threonine protein kinase